MAFHGPSYGLDADLQERLKEKYDPALESAVREWIQAVLGEPLGADLHESLKSGVILCNLVNKIRPGVVKNIQKGKAPFIVMENINAYLNACAALGLPATDLFQTVDLYEAKNMVAVLTNLHALGKFSSKIPGFAGPYLQVRK
eukprot:TRINITY_DN2270_c0_g1_i1.p1 TRINITY_DN2270_c0_g1~~TRINITY_DN2270_c0_g1_i1.p1  ORF type:complete len:143 (+),score=45.37 TRINITY_DN2270_c0_g1_i1:107-535(+)